MQNNKVNTVRQGRSRGEHVGHCSKKTSLYECFFEFMSKVRIPVLITSIKMSGYITALSLSIKNNESS